MLKQMITPKHIGLFAIALTAIVVGVMTWFGIAGAGGPPNPGANVHPGFVGQTPPPAPTAIGKPQTAGAGVPAVLGQDAVIQRVMSVPLAPGDSIDPSGAHAELHTFADLTQLRADGRNYVADYPIWVVSVSGRFTPQFGPPGVTTVVETRETYYLDGYSGAGIGLQLDIPATPASVAPMATPIPVRDASTVIDAETATQDVVKLAGNVIQSGTVTAVLTTFGTVQVDIAKQFASAYPVWVVTADAAEQIHGQPAVRTFYVDGYSGEILVTVTALAASPTP